MILFRKLFVVLLLVGFMGSLAACGETTIQGTGTGTQFNPVTGQPVQTEQKIDVKAKKSGIFAPSAQGLLNGMTGANAGGGSYLYGGVPYQGYVLADQPNYVWLRGTTFSPYDGSPVCPNPIMRPGGQRNCGFYIQPAYQQYGYPYPRVSGGGGYYGTGDYYTTRQNGQWVQKQNIQPGFKVNLLPDGNQATAEEQEFLRELERKLNLRLEEERLSKFQGA